MSSKFLTPADPEPPVGTVVESAGGDRWYRDPSGGRHWYRGGAGDVNAESWEEVAGNHVRVVEAESLG